MLLKFIYFPTCSNFVALFGITLKWGMTDHLEIKRHFIWRRAFRSALRSVVRADLIEAFGCSNTAASTLLTSVVNAAGEQLQRDGNKVIAPVWAKPPHWADEVDLMESLDHGRTSFAETGLRASELPVNISSWSSNLPSVPGAMTIIVEALTRKRSTYIQYVGLKAGDTARFRRVYPIVLERMGDQWRLVAHDLEVAECPLKIFVLSRITGASADPVKPPRDFLPSSHIDYKTSVAVDWDLRLNEDQKQALRSELGIDRKGMVQINSRDLHEFLIRFGGRTVSENIVWPPLRAPLKNQ